VSRDADVAEPVDPDSGVRVVSQRRELVRSHGAVLVVVGLGGGLGALARYGLSELLPRQPGGFPWGTFTVNVAGCFLIGILMVLISEVWSAHRLVRPFLGTGVLGGFTTFSTYALEVRGLLRSGSAEVALAHLAGTLICSLLAVIAAVWLARVTTRSVRGVWKAA
jgi:CrcB protein